METVNKQPSRFSKNERRVFIALIVLGVVLIGFFGLRTIKSYIRLMRTGLEQGATDPEVIRGWMTIPYIAVAYGIPEEYIFKQIGIPREDNQKKSLAQLNRKYAPNEKGVILNAVKTVIKKYQAEHPPQTGGEHG